jgi:hypothetical protein
MGRREALQNRRDVGEGVVVRATKPHRADDVRGPKGRHHLVAQRQDLPGPRQQITAMRRQFDPAALAAAEHPLAQACFKAADLHRNGGLRAADEAGGLGETVAIGDQHESTQQVGVETIQRKHAHQNM